MKTIILQILFCFIVMNCKSQTQSEMNREAYLEYKQSEKKIDSVYRKILAKYKSDTLFIKNLKIAERLWIKFRDAEMEMKFPHVPQEYGSVFPMCWSNHLEYLTEQRIKTLEEWLAKNDEGDACPGSINAGD